MLQPSLANPAVTISRRPRVLMISTEYRLYRVGGLGAHVRALVPRLSNLTDIELFLPRFDQFAPETETAGEFGRVFRVDADQPEGGDWFDVNVWRMNDQVNAGITQRIELGERYDVLHAHDWLTGYVANDLHARYGIPLVVTFHATEHGRRYGHVYEPLSRRIHEAEVALARNADVIITCSDFMRQEVHEQLGVERRKIVVIPNGVDVEEYAHLQQNLVGVSDLPERWTESGGPLVFFIGRLVWEKGPDLLVAAMSQVVRQYPQARAVIGGTGPLIAQLHDDVWHLGLQECVFLPGFVEDATRDALYAAADVAVFPSRYEPFGIVALEAMATGIPLVTSAAGGLGEVVENERTGLVVTPNDVNALAAAILRTLDAPDRAAERARQAQVHVAAHYHWDHIAELTLDAYRTVT